MIFSHTSSISIKKIRNKTFTLKDYSLYPLMQIFKIVDVIKRIGAGTYGTIYLGKYNF